MQLAWTNVANPQPSGYELQIAKDSGFQQIEDDSPQLNNPNRTVLSLTAGQKFWRVRSAQGDSSPTTAAVTAWSASGSFTHQPSATGARDSGAYQQRALQRQHHLGAVAAQRAAPAAGAVINLTSSNPSGCASARISQHAGQHRMDAVPDSGRTGHFIHASNSYGHAQLRTGQRAIQRAAALA